MKAHIMQVHKHDGSTRVTIPKEIIVTRGWEAETHFIFYDNGDGNINLAPAGDITRLVTKIKMPSNIRKPHPTECTCPLCLKIVSKYGNLQTTET